MACSASKTPLLRSVASRGFAASRSNAEIQTTTLQNKIVVATSETNSALSRVSILFRAGSRCESYDQLGTSHVIRATAAISNTNSTAFNVVRGLGYVGGNLSASSDREVIAYSVDINRADLATGLEQLVNASVHQMFKPWELTDLASRVSYETNRLSNDIRAVEALHSALFHGELGNSLYCSPNNVSRLTPGKLQNYVRANFTASRAAVVGIGVDHQLLVGIAKHLELETGQSGVAASKANVGDVRIDEQGAWTTVAIGTQGASWANRKEALAFGVLQQIAGTGSNVKGGEANGALGKVLSGALGNSAFGFTALNASYSDNGLFGVLLVTEASESGKAVEAVVKALKAGSVSSGDLARGKEQLKSALLEEVDSTAGLVTNIGSQALLTGAVQNISDVLAAVDALTSSDVNAAAKKVASGKWSVGAVGNLGKVPYASQLN